MLDIIICEDNEMQREKIECIIKNKLIDLKLDLKIVLSADNSKDVVNHLKNNIEKSFIYFLDVDLGTKSNGIDLAKEIRNYDTKGYIVFITSHAELSFLTFKYKVRAFDYILKFDDEALKSSISECLSGAYNNYKNVNVKEKEVISINLVNRIENFLFNEILFFETADIGHKLRGHTTNGHFEFYGKMKDLEAKLPSYFYKCHRSYIVNTTKIKFFDKKNKTIYMINDEICYSSALYLKGLIKKCLI
ncbi:LytTR family DNA-binding domain-containing protein [Clostridium sp. CM028]|uniref:LytR/AlgR family response regulator transcription factor n=1 Tax=unclassified Clostridium TaxID=2614128 RepID=UPI001C0B7BF3|nr:MULTISPECIES: LytTR family DNA-binding domain-containing protein [unclassified Clostridium]MBU3092400.1 LytTR family DNA-binding domain-containing protein [Clostridium sp. CF011]MBW9146029.1 LytTR family DNA-binding domain-containing protein [Clostridium sp. CM027]MBW9149895.1 LytTR family DNA-binding domain-containing protein [Clostridium sp. CM028]UVE39499.1 LytTR family DNA-binding domain-containing protein [Clostridium sp. CM027]WAG68411.1 LytTR family DNA-binding domain-containing prot